MQYIIIYLLSNYLAEKLMIYAPSREMNCRKKKLIKSIVGGDIKSGNKFKYLLLD